MNRVCRAALGGCFTLAILTSPRVGSAQDTGAQEVRARELRALLEHLRTDGLWGEIILRQGSVRQVRVEALGTDTVAVREMIGPLQGRAAAYAVADIRSARELGVHRIPQRMAPYRPPTSVTRAVALELVLPGGGYFYAGQTRQGYTLLGVTALAAATAVATGKDGAAGWIPVAAWIKAASVLHLRDEVAAVNGALRDRAEGRIGAAPGPLPIASATIRF